MHLRQTDSNTATNLRLNRTDRILIHLANYAISLQKLGEALITRIIRSPWTQRKTRQSILKRQMMNLIIQLLLVRNKRLPRLIRMIQHKLRRLLQSQIKTAKTIIMRLILTGNNNHLIISRHTMLFRKKSLARLTRQFQLMQFKIAITADYRINLPAHQRRTNRPIHIDRLHIFRFQTALCQ